MSKKLLLSLALLFFCIFTFPRLVAAQAVDTEWVRVYNGQGRDTDSSYAVAVDVSGNVYVSGTSHSSENSYDYATIKYYPNGDTAWVRIYDSPGNGFDAVDGMVLDKNSNVYVTGWSSTIKYDANGNLVWAISEGGWNVAVDEFSNVYISWDGTTIKYDSLGNQVWLGHWGGNYITTDRSGNVYVGTTINRIGSGNNYLTVKYNRGGDTAWVREYNGPANYSDWLYALAVDPAGNVFVTGYSYGGGTGYDFATIKYKPNGDTAWVRRHNGTGNLDEGATAITLDVFNDVCVTGCGYNGTAYNYLTVKYDPQGNELWARTYNNGSIGNWDAPSAIAADSSGNVYVTGTSTGNETGLDFATIKYDPAGNEEWVKRYGEPGNGTDEASDIAVDKSGNIYITGFSCSQLLNFDFATLKYLPNGDTAWLRRYRGLKNTSDRAQALAVDHSGSVYISGTTESIKYDPQGNVSWTGPWAGPDLVLDQEDNVFVAGTSGGGNPDYMTAKYYPDGEVAWVKRYDGPWGAWDLPSAMAIDHNQNIYVTGESWGGWSAGDYATIKYTGDGDTVWVRRYNGPASLWDWAADIIVDHANNIYVTGGSYYLDTNYSYLTIKYDPGGNTLWERRYIGPGGVSDWSSSMIADDSDNIYITGCSYGDGTDGDIATLKYDSYGNQLWVQRYNGTANGMDCGADIAIDRLNNIYVTGESWGGMTGRDYITIKYDSRGNQLWVERYDGGVYLPDSASAVTVDDFDYVYVTGASCNHAGDFDYLTIKYDPDGNLVWTQRYSGPGYADDRARAIAVDDSDNVYMTGESYGGITGFDYLTIKYVQTTCGNVNQDQTIDIEDIVFLINFVLKDGPAPYPARTGDVDGDGMIDLSDVVFLIKYLYQGGPKPCS